MHSLLIISYNSEKTIGRALNSIESQTCRPDEVIISDDGSSDNTLSVIAQFQEKMPDLIKVHSNPKNVGIAKNLKIGLSLTKGDFITILAGDDWLDMHAFEIVNKKIKESQRENGIDVIIPHIMMHGNEETNIAQMPYLDVDNLVANILDSTFTFTKFGVPRACLIDAEYPTEVGIWGDLIWDLNIASMISRVHVLDKVLYHYDNTTGVSKRQKKMCLMNSRVSALEYVLRNKPELTDKDLTQITSELFMLKVKLLRLYDLSAEEVFFIMPSQFIARVLFGFNIFKSILKGLIIRVSNK